MARIFGVARRVLTNARRHIARLGMRIRQRTHIFAAMAAAVAKLAKINEHVSII
jgi:nitrate reductase assembly molybdenum cofactor insertion protein NarJ